MVNPSELINILSSEQLHDKKLKTIERRLSAYRKELGLKKSNLDLAATLIEYYFKVWQPSMEKFLEVILDKLKKAGMEADPHYFSIDIVLGKLRQKKFFSKEEWTNLGLALGYFRDQYEGESSHKVDVHDILYEHEEEILEMIKDLPFKNIEHLTQEVAGMMKTHPEKFSELRNFYLHYLGALGRLTGTFNPGAKKRKYARLWDDLNDLFNRKEAEFNARPKPNIAAMLRILYGEERGKRFELVGTEFTIGRSENADIKLADPTIAEVHAILYLTPDGARIKDTSSDTSFRVNGRIVDNEVSLQDGAHIEMGGMVLSFSLIKK